MHIPMPDLLRNLFVLVISCLSFTTPSAQPLLTLEEAIRLAIAKNLDIQLARNEQEIADIQNNWGNAGRLPTVTGSSGYNYSNTNLRQKLANGTEFNRNGASFQSENASVLAQWPIFAGYRVVAAKKRLEELERIGELQVRQQANQTAYNVITAYLNILRFNSQLQATRESIALFEERMRLAENRFNIGTAGKSDYLQALVDLNQQKNLVLVIENNIAQSKVQLNNQLNRNPDEPFRTTDSIAAARLPDRREMLAAIDSLNPQLLINKSQELVLMQQAREINAQRLPTVNLNLGGNLNNSNNNAGFIQRNTTYGPNAGVQVAIPIFQGGVVKQQLKVNEVQQKSQQLSYQALRNDLQAILVNAYNNYQNAEKQYKLELDNLEVVKENNFIAMERFRKASITTVELRQTQLNLIESQTRMINALYDMKQSEADVLLIMGRLVQ